MKLKTVSVEFEHAQKWRDKYEMKIQDFALPRYVIGGDGPKILVVTDRKARSDYDDKRLLSGNTQIVFENILRHLVKNGAPEPSEILVIEYEVFSPRKMTDVDAAEAHKQFGKRIEYTIEKYQPDRIIFLGREPVRRFMPHKTLEDPTVLLNRLRTIKINGQKYKAVGTISLNHVSLEFNPEDSKSAPNLIGVVMRGFETVLRGKNRYTVDNDNFKYRVVDTIEKFKKFYKKLLRSETPAFDVETDSLNRVSNNMLMMQWSFDGRKAYAVPINHPDTPFSPSELRYIKRKMREYFEFGKSKYIIGHYLKFDMHQVMDTFEVRYINHRLYDLPSAEFCLDENRKFLNDIGISAYSLAQLANEYGCTLYHHGALTKSDRGNMRSFTIEQIAEYGCKDVIVPFQIHNFQIEEAERRGKTYAKFLKTVCEQISDMIHSFTVMEHNGIFADRKYLVKQMSKVGDFQKIIDGITEKYKNSKAAQEVNRKLLKSRGLPQQSIFSKGNDGGTNWLFRINDDEHAQLLFFDVLRLTPLEKRDSGGGSLDKAFQKHYAPDGAPPEKVIPEVQWLRDYNEASKMKNTFIKGIFKKMSASSEMKDGRIRPTFKHLEIITGRAGQEDPSMHQIPSRGKLSKAVKRQFIAPLGKILLKADYSAHEVRNWGNIAGDTLISNAFRVGLNIWQTYRLLKMVDDEIRKQYEPKFFEADIHRVNYAFFYPGVKPKDVNKEQRQSIKTVVFGVIYGKGAKSLAAEIGCSVEEAQALIDKLGEKFKGGWGWIKNIHEVGKDKLRVTSPLGRVRHLYGYLHWDRGVHGMMDRRGPNSIIQGTSSDFGFMGCRRMMKLIWDFFEKHDQPFSFRTTNSVHDSSENEVAIVELPIACYLLEHSYTTQVHKRYRETFGAQMLVDLQMEMDFGPALSHVEGWDYSNDQMMKIVDNSLKFFKDELGYNLDNRRILRDTLHNQEIMNKLRRKELKADLEVNKGASEYMILNEDNVRDYDLRFDHPKYVLEAA